MEIVKRITLRENIYKTVSIKEASKIMGKSEQFIRVGLRNKRLPFGVAVKLSSQWTYYISPKLFYEYVGDCSSEKIINID